MLHFLLWDGGTAVAGPSAPVVSIDQASLSVPVGGTRQLSATVEGEPEPSLAWGTSDGLIATVSAAGLVTGVAPGSATITATATNTEGSDDDTVPVNVFTPSGSSGRSRGVRAAVL